MRCPHPLDIICMETKPYIAIVDDDAISRLFLADMVESVGLVPMCFEFPEHFLAYVEVYKPVCIILDMNMPGLNGAEVEFRLKEIGADIPVIVVTGDTDLPTARAALHGGAVEVFTKPVDPLDLLTLIREILTTGVQAEACLTA